MPTYPAGEAGAGMVLKIFVEPNDVSFKNVLLKEIPGPASNIMGYFTTVTPSELNHIPNPKWISATDFFDRAFISGVPPTSVNPNRWTPGSFEWDIPWHWITQSELEDLQKNDTNANPATGTLLQNVIQKLEVLDTNGTCQVTKLGETERRNP